jgi:hypothetical protein
MVVVGDRVTVDRMDDRRENKEPLTDDAVPVTRLLTPLSPRSHPAHQFHSRRRQSLRTAQLIPTRRDGKWRCGLICSLISLLDVQHTDHANVFEKISNK